MRASVTVSAIVGAAVLLAGCGGDEPGSDAAPLGQGGMAGGSGAAGQGGAGGTGGSAGNQPPTLGGCAVFTADDEWNRDISTAPVDAQWTANVLALAGDIQLHPDFGNWGGEQYGIPINVVGQSQAAVPVVFDSYPDESDPGPYPLPEPSQAKIEGGDPYSCAGDCHLLVVQQGACKLYEGFACEYQSDGWHCGNGAVWDLTKLSYGQRPLGWTSADAAGLPIAAGLVRYDEVAADDVRHAIRFTMRCTRSVYVKPATHYAVPGDCPNSEAHPPMGLRVRLKASFDITPYPPSARAILKAMKRYGMILADNGSDFFFQAEAHEGWGEDVQELKQVPVSAFEVIAPAEP